MKMVLAAAAVIFASAGLAGNASAQEFYKGKQIRLIVGSASGGGYDGVARLLQRFMPQYIDGNPTIVVVNMPGAGGLVAANHFANIAEKDGTVLGVLNRFAAIMPVLGSLNLEPPMSLRSWRDGPATWRARQAPGLSAPARGPCASGGSGV